MRHFFTAIATLVALASAEFLQPDYSKAPEGNAIFTPGLNEIVPQGEPYKITWDANTPGPITLQLLRGPSENVVPIAVIAEHLPNTGSFLWEPAGYEPDVTHYGILLIDESTLGYQYSTQFGLGEDPNAPPADSSSSADPTITTSSVAPPLVTATSTAAPTETGIWGTGAPVPPVPTQPGQPEEPFFPGAGARNLINFGGAVVAAGAAAVLAL
ncbi:hypothetical protein VTN31DRAFT_3335 [Thermomyces dupontii]|uniref:uncharacterized protein n=1 Tax=Talaromyces thermophilus TaxID=28565 RepID=UPI0037422E46